jgi:hypothetical protein
MATRIANTQLLFPSLPSAWHNIDIVLIFEECKQMISFENPNDPN